MKRWALLIGLCLASPLGAQAAEGASARSGTVALPMIGGVLGSGVGLVGGALLGVGLSSCDDSHNDFCELGGAFIGAAVGSTVGSSLGAFVSSRIEHESPSLLASFAGGVLGVGVGFLAASAAARWTQAGDGSLIVAFAVAQGAFTGLVTHVFSRD